MLRFLLVLLPVLIFSGCGDTSFEKPRSSPADGAIYQPVADPGTDYDKKIEEAKARRDKAVLDNDRLGILQAERDEFLAKKIKAEAQVSALANAITAKDGEIRSERLDIARTRAYWIAGVCAFLGAAALAVSFFVNVPILSKGARILAGAFGALAVMAMFFAWLVPYLVPITVGLGVLAVGCALWHWRADAKGLGQAVQAIEPIKGAIINPAQYLASHFDTDVEKRIKKIRDAKGLSKAAKEKLAEA